MIKTSFVVACCLWTFLLRGQFNKDSLLRSLGTSRMDVNLVDTLLNEAEKYLYSKPTDSAYWLAQKARVVAQRINDADGLARATFVMGKINKQIGNYLSALELYRQSQRMYERTANGGGIAGVLLFTGEIYAYQGNHPLAQTYFFRAKDLFAINSNEYGVSFCFLKIGESYEKMDLLDSSLFYLGQISLLKNQTKTTQQYLGGRISLAYGNLAARKNEFEIAAQYYRQCLALLVAANEDRTICQVMLRMAGLFEKRQQEDSSIHYARQSLDMAQRGRFTLEVYNASEFLYHIYRKQQQYQTALRYLESSIAAKENLFSRATTDAIEKQRIKEEYELQFEKQRDEFQHREAVAEQQNKMRIIIFVAVLFVFFTIAFILWRNNKQKQVANLLLQRQKQEVQNTLAELKALQQQLIHAEKMASLGEVTAGIAHEIQNPLNFINNFSELSSEILGDIKESLRNGNTGEALETMASLEMSLQKINHHGRRADGIVKNMLQHSRKQSNAREQVDVNKLVDEYLRLSYEAMRAKDPSFHAILETHFQNDQDMVEMNPQDMGRVLLNLFNNAFYAICEKKKTASNSYEPTIQVTTHRKDSLYEIRVRDNGMGIPEKVMEKIYQPFFTTKPAGQGTGLGLSLSYDIVTKVHGGTMTVNSRQGEYAEFVIAFPIHQQ